jgi:hypothetical protein
MIFSLFATLKGNNGIYSISASWGRSQINSLFLREECTRSRTGCQRELGNWGITLGYIRMCRRASSLGAERDAEEISARLGIG